MVEVQKSLHSTALKAPLAIISHSHPSVSKGGAEIAAYTLFKGLVSLGANAIFIAACPSDSRSRLDLGSRREHAIVCEPSGYDHFYHLASPRLWQELSAILQRHNIELVNFHHYLHVGINSLRRIACSQAMKVVMSFHEFLAICHHHGQMVTRPGQLLCKAASPSSCTACFPEHSPQQFKLRRELFLDTFGIVDGFVSPSRFLADRYAAWGLPAERLTVIENGLAQAAPDAPRARRLAADRWVFGYFGQITPFKGVDTVLQAAGIIARNPDLAARIAIRIHGNFVGQSEEFIARLTAAVERHPFLSYAGPYENTLAGDLMSECDYVVVPSRWWENSPVVIQEAFAVGRPVVCSGIGGMAEKVTDGVSGLHYRMGDPDDLVRVLTRAADDALLVKLQAGLPRVADGRRMAEAYLSLFDRLLADTPVAELPQSEHPTTTALRRPTRKRLAAKLDADGALHHAQV
jgi:glycosyltransferase involved in cell wall biosynthesis